MRMLILGASGFIGAQIKSYFTAKGHQVIGTYQTANETYRQDDTMHYLGLEDDKCYALLRRLMPQVIIYCLRGAFDKQFVAVKEITTYIKENPSVRFIFLSTANVFDGDRSCQHTETDKVNAASNYGKHKILCEHWIQQELQGEGIILRLPAVYEKACPRIERLKTLAGEKKGIDTISQVAINITTCKQITEWMDYVITHHLKGIFHVGTDDTCDYMILDQRLISGLALGEVTFNIEQEEKQCYFAVIPHREEIPVAMHLSMQQVVAYLINR